ncbi:hypothetical protein KIN20_006931 [Parelaphostrongylus tenuis]|uniref:Uncharacterized protein n=1 Tax=Parelaphostrongylus tenuis TaxID=148309 RepID=A0AAD5QGF7_PARTN|nr:hypothetical protein KIN20_006931 [Parelaphostrongylus tenuis]
MLILRRRGWQWGERRSNTHGQWAEPRRPSFTSRRRWGVVASFLSSFHLLCCCYRLPASLLTVLVSSLTIVKNHCTIIM